MCTDRRVNSKWRSATMTSRRKTSNGCWPFFTNGRSLVEVDFQYRTLRNPLIPCFTVMGNNPKQCLNLRDVLWQLRAWTVKEKVLNLMTAINGSLGLLRVRASMFAQLPTTLTKAWTRTCGWVAGRNSIRRYNTFKGL